MTLRELRGFLHSASKKKILQRIEMITATAIGAQSDKKGIKESVSDLQNILKDISDER